MSQLIHRAEELEVPILKVELDTLSSVEIIEQAFGHVRIHELSLIHISEPTRPY